jgi:hypothetical protein
MEMRSMSLSATMVMMSIIAEPIVAVFIRLASFWVDGLED